MWLNLYNVLSCTEEGTFIEGVGGRFKDVCVFLRPTFFFHINASRGEVSVVI